MKTMVVLLATTTALGFAVSGLATNTTADGITDIKYKDNGGYEMATATESYNANGTKTVVDKSTEVDISDDGKITRKEEVKTKTDPKGLLNKATSEVEHEYEDKDDGYVQKSIHNRTDADGTDVNIKSTNDVNFDEDGNVEAVIETEKKVDPKGLFNKETTTEKTKVVNGRVVEHKVDE